MILKTEIKFQFDAKISLELEVRILDQTPCLKINSILPMGKIFLEFAFELWRSPGVRGVQVFAGMGLSLGKKAG